MRLFNSGDTFSGTVEIDSCADLPDHPAAIIITESEGNVVRAQFVSKVGDKVRSFETKGFFHVASKRLILIPEKYGARSLSLVCLFEDSENEATCKLLKDNFSRQCGTIKIKRDYTGKFCLRIG